MVDVVMHYFDDIVEGMSGEFVRTVTDSGIHAFAEASGDFNPIHLDDAYARTTPFGGRIAHGMLTAAFISAALGSVFPGAGWVYVDQTLKFRAPVRIGDVVTAKVMASGLVPEKRFVQFVTTCTVNGKVVLEGTATLMAPKRAAAA